MHKISEFARLANVSIRLLHYYDEIGLLRPAHVDPDSGYRYYSVDQLLPLNRILALKDLGFTLEEIALLLKGSSPDETLRDLLQRKRQELRQRISDDQARLEEMELRLTALDAADSPPVYDVILKPVPAREALSTVVQIDGSVTIAEVFKTIYDVLQARGLRRAITQTACLYLDHRAYRGVRVEPVHIEVVFAVDHWALQPIQINDSITLTPNIIPACEVVASALHRGSDFHRGVAHHAVMRWIAQYHGSVIAPVREVYLRRCHPDEHITELQFPITAQIPVPGANGH